MREKDRGRERAAGGGTAAALRELRRGGRLPAEERAGDDPRGLTRGGRRGGRTRPLLRDGGREAPGVVPQRGGQLPARQRVGGLVRRVHRRRADSQRAVQRLRRRGVGDPGRAAAVFEGPGAARPVLCSDGVHVPAAGRALAHPVEALRDAGLPDAARRHERRARRLAREWVTVQQTRQTAEKHEHTRPRR